MQLEKGRLAHFTGVVVVVCMVFWQDDGQADVIRDGTIGPDVSVQPTGPDFEIPESHGELNGANLFHSFQAFSLSQDQSATFSGTSPINNIIGRVTGGDSSHIDGLLRSTVPGASLYLMNPNGVIFGANAQLDAQGAFHAGTAGQLVFAGGEVFSAIPEGGPPILSMAIPESFGFLGASAAPVELYGATLQSDHDVVLSGGTVALYEGARIVTATDGVRDGADIVLMAMDGVTLSGLDNAGAGSGLDARSQGDGAAGAIRVEAPLIELNDGAWMSAAANGAGNGGAVQLVAGERLTLSGWDGAGQGSNLRTRTDSEGHAGIIRIEAPVIEFADGAYATTATAGAGNGGELLVTATERLTLSGQNSAGSGAAFDAGAAALGNGGTLRATAPVIELNDGASMSTTTSGVGESGDVLILASQRLTLAGTDGEGFGARVQANSRSQGAAGNILVSAPVIALRDGASIQSSTAGAGVGGELLLSVTELLTLSGTDDNGFGSSLQTTAIGVGQGGTLSVDAARIELHDGAFMAASTAGAGLGGALSVNVSGLLKFSGTDEHGAGSGLAANALEQGDGVGIEIYAGEIALSQGAYIASTSVGTGDAGSIAIVTEGDLQLTGQSTISTAAFSASGGNIDIQADGVVHLSDSEISTNVGSGSGGGGDIVAQADVLVLNHGSITAQADSGSGGNIQISTRQVLATPDSLIDASTGPAGIDGHVAITAPERDLGGELARPSSAFLDVNASLHPGCEARAQGSPGSFRVARQQGLPLSPENLLLAFDGFESVPANAFPQRVSALGVGGETRGMDLRGIAIRQQAEGRYSESLETLTSALMAQNDQDPHQLANVLGSAANAYLALGQADTAMAYFDQALNSAGPDQHSALAALHNNLGNLHMVRQETVAAAMAYAQSVKHARRAGDDVQVAKALSNGARADLAEGRHGRAAALLAQARDAARGLAADREKAYILIHLAKTAQQISRAEGAFLETAYTDLRAAAMLSRQLGDDRTLSYALGNLGALYQRQQRLDEALYLTRLAQQAAQRANAPESHYRWHWQAGKLLWTQGNYQSALQAYRRAVAILEGSRPETLAQYGAAQGHFRQAVAAVYLDFVDALLQHSSRSGDASALLLEARATVEQLKAAELRNYFRDECITDLEARTTRLEAVSPSAAIVYPIILPQRLELLVSLPGGLRRYPVDVDAATLGQAISRFRSQVQTRGAERQLRHEAQRLYDWLVRPYADALDHGDIDTLVFVPDGPLRTAPLAALHDGRNYLIRRYGVVVTPGLSLTDPRPLNRSSPRLLLAGLSDAVQDFPALPHVPRELARVQQLFGGRVLLDQNFTLPRVTQALDVPVSIVHLASHAQFTGNPEDSYLLTHDGRLSMDQLGHVLEVTRFRDQPIELLVLSACQTAVGDDRAAMGLAGIGLKAGARSALGSLWFISDEGTSELMSEFYQQLKDPGLTKAQALQQAQQAMLADGRFAHPFFWSPFLLINNWL